jgi:Uma2 family endonuclease
MNIRTTMPAPAPIDYPDSDGLPIAENTIQFEWIVTIKGSLDDLYRAEDHVFVAGDLLWYPVEGNNTLCTAPDTLVAFGPGKGYRSSYQQWEEGDVAPQVTFEVLSPGNRAAEMAAKLEFYERYGVEEYYVLDPYRNEWSGWLRQAGRLQQVARMENWVSPRLGVRFGMPNGRAQLYHPDGRPFATYLEISAWAKQERQEKEAALARVDHERQEKEKALARAERLEARLRALGIDPEGPD